MKHCKIEFHFCAFAYNTPPQKKEIINFGLVHCKERVRCCVKIEPFHARNESWHLSLCIYKCLHCGFTQMYIAIDHCRPTMYIRTQNACSVVLKVDNSDFFCKKAQQCFIFRKTILSLQSILQMMPCTVGVGTVWKSGSLSTREIYAKILQVRNLSVYLQSELVATADVAQLARAADL